MGYRNLALVRNSTCWLVCTWPAGGLISRWDPLGNRMCHANHYAAWRQDMAVLGMRNSKCCLQLMSALDTLGPVPAFPGSKSGVMVHLAQ